MDLATINDFVGLGIKAIILEDGREIIISASELTANSNSVAWGNITGDITNQSDLFALFQNLITKDSFTMNPNQTISFTDGVNTVTVRPNKITGLKTSDIINNTDAVNKQYVDLLVSGALVSQGVWNANTNTPTLTSSIGTLGHLYVVNVAGTTNLNGNNNWNAGDVLFFASNGVWNRIPAAVGTAWGAITGSLSAQTDLINTLNLKSDKRLIGSTKTGAYTLQLSDEHKIIKLDGLTEYDITIPSGFEEGVQIFVLQISSSGNKRIIAGAGVTIQSNDSLNTLNGFHAGVTLIHLGSDVWTLQGNLK